MDLETLKTKLQGALDANKGKLPKKTYVLEIVGGPTFVLDGTTGRLLEGNSSEADCTITTSLEHLETLLKKPEKAGQLVFTRKITISNLMVLLPLVKVIKGAFA